MYFEYGDTETDFLKAKDQKLAQVIERVGHINRPVDDNLFSSVIHHIIGQQISTAAQKTIWKRAKEKYGDLTPEILAKTSVADLQSLGVTFKKAEYIKNFVEKVQSREFDLKGVAKMSDKDAIRALTSLKGIGTWTAEMILLLCLKRPDILSYDDLAIQRGMRMLYHHRNIDKKLFEKYHRRYSPYGSVASLYLWAIAGGAIPDLGDPAPKKKEIK